MRQKQQYKVKIEYFAYILRLLFWGKTHIIKGRRNPQCENNALPFIFTSSKRRARAENRDRKKRTV